MTDRAALFRSLSQDLGLGPVPQSLIAGQLTDGEGAPITLEDPYARVPLAQYPDAGAKGAQSACAAAATAQRIWWKDFSAAARGNLMQDIARAVDAKAETLAKMEALVAGKPIRDCRVEVAKVAEMFRYYAGWTDKLHGEVIPVPSGHLNYTLRQPLGCGFPDHAMERADLYRSWQIAPAIACGNGGGDQAK